MEAPDFWDDADKSQKYMKELNELKSKKEGYEELVQEYEDIMTMIQMGYEEEDESLIEEIGEMFDGFKEKLENMRIDTLLSDEYDKYNAILSLHAGAGGTDPPQNGPGTAGRRKGDRTA